MYDHANLFVRDTFCMELSLGTLLPTSVCSARSKAAQGGVVLNPMSNKVDKESPNDRYLKQKKKKWKVMRPSLQGKINTLLQPLFLASTGL